MLREKVRRLFLRRLRDASVAEDLAQDVILKACVYMRQSPLGNPNAFVFTAALNHLRDHVRRRRVRAQYVEDLAHADAPDSEASVGFDAERVLIGQEGVRRVMAALGELGERTRTIYILHRVDRVRQREIAALYGISVSAVEKHIVRATAHLAHWVGRE